MLWSRARVPDTPFLERENSVGASNLEAQLRGIPVVSTAACGLKEANFVKAGSRLAACFSCAVASESEQSRQKCKLFGLHTLRQTLPHSHG